MQVQTRDKPTNSLISIVIPTYNESQNICNILKSIEKHLLPNFKTEAIVVDDNSPDGTGNIVEDYIKSVKELANYSINVIHRETKNGLSSAILKGIEYSTGDIVVVMDSDFSHPPQIIPNLVEALKKSKSDIVIASRYIKGGKIEDWSIKRRLISKTATKIAKYFLGVKTKDPMSGFFAFRKNLIDGLKFDAIGYKMLLELLVKKRGAKVLEIPYQFTDRANGKSKLNYSTMFDYGKSVWKLYRYGDKAKSKEPRKGVSFLSKGARFFTVGASGLLVNYLASLFFVSGFTSMWFLHANMIGIAFSITSNFIFNKIWTFEDRDFAPKKTILQYGKFVLFSSIGAVVQLGMVFYLVNEHSISYPASLVLAVGTAAFSNFVLNKKWTFKEKVWN